MFARRMGARTVEVASSHWSDKTVVLIGGSAGIGAAHGRHGWPPRRPRPRDLLRCYRRAASVRGGPRARVRSGSRRPHGRRLRRHPAVGVAARRPARRASGAATARRCRSAGSSAPPTSPRSPYTSWPTRRSPARPTTSTRAAVRLLASWPRALSCPGDQ